MFILTLWSVSRYSRIQKQASCVNSSYIWSLSSFHLEIISAEKVHSTKILQNRSIFYLIILYTLRYNIITIIFKWLYHIILYWDVYAYVYKVIYTVKYIYGIFKIFTTGLWVYYLKIKNNAFIHFSLLYYDY